MACARPAFPNDGPLSRQSYLAHRFVEQDHVDWILEIRLIHEPPPIFDPGAQNERRHVGGDQRFGEMGPASANTFRP